MKKILTVIGVGNMAKAILRGIDKKDSSVEKVILVDSNSSQYESLRFEHLNASFSNSIKNAINDADYILISVKPQNYNDVLSEIALVNGHNKKIYISIGAGITSQSVSEKLNGATVIRVLPNLPMLIGKGLSAICKNEAASKDNFDFVCEIFASAGSNIIIDESQMNRIIGVTSSSPAYVFKFANAIYKGAIEQGIDGKEILDAVCDVIIGSALMLKSTEDSPEALISKVASKGGTTERALRKLDEYDFDKIIAKAMADCTARADELGKN